MAADGRNKMRKDAKYIKPTISDDPQRQSVNFQTTQS